MDLNLVFSFFPGKLDDSSAISLFSKVVDTQDGFRAVHKYSMGRFVVSVGTATHE